MRFAMTRAKNEVMNDIMPGEKTGKPILRPFPLRGEGGAPSLAALAPLAAFTLAAFALALSALAMVCSLPSISKAADEPGRLAEAAYLEGMRHLLADGVPEDEEEAAKLFVEAARLGSAPAMYRLGRARELGQGAELSHVEAVRLYTLASEAGSADAMFRLGILYATGLGVPKKDREVGLGYFIKAAEAGHVEARELLYIFPDFGAPLPPSDGATIERLKKEAEAGDAYACGVLGFFSAFGLGVEADGEAALGFYEASARLGLPRGRYVMGRTYSIGLIAAKKVVDIDHEKANAWLILASDGGGGVPEAKRFLGLARMIGWGAPQDLGEALALMEEAAESGDVEGAFVVGNLYREGGVFEADASKAARWLSLAAEGGHAGAKIALGIVLETGEGFGSPDDKAKAAKLTANHGA